METIAKGLHGLNNKLPKLVLKRDFLAFTLQIFSLFLCMFSGITWAIFGFDSTIDGAIRVMEGVTPAEMGNGTHWSTVLNFFLIVFLISVYLSSKNIIGFHNVIVSLFTPIVGMMVFEWPWVIFTDIFHNIPVEGYAAITLYGIGSIDLGMLILGVALIPTAIFYFAYHLSFEKIKLGAGAVLKASAFSWAASAALLTFVCVWFGTPNILIRNTFALFFIAFSHATFMDATRFRNYSVESRKMLPWIILWAAGFVFIIWIFWSDFILVKGVLWPQTVYAFYNSGSLVETVWIPNDAIHLFNVLSKFLVTAGVSLLLIPRIKAVAKND